MFWTIAAWTAGIYSAGGLVAFFISLKWSSTMDSIKTGLMWPLALVFIIGMLGR